MASIKNLKKDINHVLGDLIEECYMWELMNPQADNKKSQAIIDEAVDVFDALLAKVSVKKIENKKSHFKSVQSDLETAATSLLGKVNKL
ncbi:MAG: hypothetical protein COB73_07805 [Flavobacteriaceae bacterium]|nr:MAG: hypothetical protein COB73_07805 [Flavobacteriaceae bacterium]